MTNVLLLLLPLAVVLTAGWALTDMHKEKK